MSTNQTETGADALYPSHGVQRNGKKYDAPGLPQRADAGAAGETLAQAMFPSVAKRLQPEGKKIEPHSTNITPAGSVALGRGDLGAYTPAALPKELGFVFWQEPPAGSITDYAMGMNLGPGYDTDDGGAQLEAVKKGLLEAQVGTTLAAALIAMAKHAIKHGPHSLTNDQARERLGGMWGADHVDAKLAAVKNLVKRMERRWPQVKDWLNTTRLGSQPEFIDLLARHAERLNA